MDISMDIHEKSVDMDMDMDAIFHIHGNPGVYCFVLLSLTPANTGNASLTPADTGNAQNKWLFFLHCVAYCMEPCRL